MSGLEIKNNNSAPKRQKKLHDDSIWKIQKIAKYYEITKGERCDIDKAVDFMYDKTLEVDKEIKQLARDMEYNSARGRLSEKYG